jgi:hypothetical protein
MRSEGTAVTHAEANTTGRPYVLIGEPNGRNKMKRAGLVWFSLLPLAACTPQPSPPASAGAQTTIPASYAAGSASNTTSAFDGMYTFVSIQNISKGNELDVAGGNAPITCQNYSNLSPITIQSGPAQFQLLGYTFQGYVTPQGHLRMGSGYGQGIEGQINNQGVFNAQGLGACAYNATWRRSS